MSNKASKACNGPNPNQLPSQTIAKQKERKLDKTLYELQKATNIKIFESKEMTEKRKAIIVEVEHLTTKWVQSCLTANDILSPSLIEKSSSYICTFGSYELNAHFASSDIDLLFIGPRHITRDMLFKEFVVILAADERVSDILVLRHAFVPLLKFTFHGIDIDLVYAQWNIDVIDLNLPKPQQINVFSNDFVQDQDTLYSLNGVRSTQTIKELIPNKALFAKTLRIIKFWAQQRAIYSNVMGFLGGISWSIMTAKICIQYADLSSTVELLTQFFNVYKDYDDSYPDIRLDPKLYRAMYDDHKISLSGSASSASHDEYVRNEYSEIMPILTPARPALNCAYNVIEPTKKLILAELKRAYEIVAGCGCGNVCAWDVDWKQLFAKRHFVRDSLCGVHLNRNVYNGYDNVYIRIQCIPDNKHLFMKKWTGFIESKIRNLVKKLNRDLFDSSFYPYANCIKHGQIDNFFISGKYNVAFDHRANNMEMIHIALLQFQNQIDISSVGYDCGNKCKLKLHVCDVNEIHAVFAKIDHEPRRSSMALQQQQNVIAQILLKPNTAQLVYPQYSILQQIQMMNITQNQYNNRPQNVFYRPPQPQPQPQRQPQPQIFSNLKVPAPAPSPAPAKESVVKSLPPKVMEKDEGNVNDGDSDRDSNASATSSTRTDTNSVSSADSPTPQSKQNGAVSFHVPNIANISSFPIIKIQQQSLPHLPPFVTTQNPHAQYPSHNGNVMNNNSVGWAHQMLLSQKRAQMKENNNIEEETNKENIIRNINIAKRHYIPPKTVNIPNSFVSDLNSIKTEQFGYPAPNNKNNNCNKVNNHKSTLIIHPVLSGNPNVNNCVSTFAVNKRVFNASVAPQQRLPLYPQQMAPQRHPLKAQQMTPQSFGNVSFRKGKNPNNSNNELLRSYQNYCNILTVFNINDNSNNQNVNANNQNVNINTINNNIIQRVEYNPAINKNVITRKNNNVSPINIGYSSPGPYTSDSSTSTSSNTSVHVSKSNHTAKRTVNAINTNINNKVLRHKNISNNQKPLYSDIINGAVTTLTATAPPIPIPPSPSPFGNAEYYNRQSKLRKKSWHHDHNNYNYVHTNNIEYGYEYNNNEYRNHNNNIYNNHIYYNNDNKWRSKSNNNYRYSTNSNKRFYPSKQRGGDRERFNC